MKPILWTANRKFSTKNMTVTCVEKFPILNLEMRDGYLIYETDRVYKIKIAEPEEFTVGKHYKFYELDNEE